jgi:hypothetical protein
MEPIGSDVPSLTWGSPFVVVGSSKKRIFHENYFQNFTYYLGLLVYRVVVGDGGGVANTAAPERTDKPIAHLRQSKNLFKHVYVQRILRRKSIIFFSFIDGTFA